MVVLLQFAISFPKPSRFVGKVLQICCLPDNLSERCLWTDVFGIVKKTVLTYWCTSSIYKNMCLFVQLECNIYPNILIEKGKYISLLLLFNLHHTCSHEDETNWNVLCSSPIHICWRALILWRKNPNSFFLFFSGLHFTIKNVLLHDCWYIFSNCIVWNKSALERTSYWSLSQNLWKNWSWIHMFVQIFMFAPCAVVSCRFNMDWPLI